MAKGTWIPMLLHILHPYVIAEHLAPKPLVLRCCYNNLHSSGNAFQKIFFLPVTDSRLPIYPKGVVWG